MDPTIPLDVVEAAAFALFALMAVAGALRVITASDPFHSALSLLFVFVSLGVLYLLLEQPFVAIAQILVYAGAVVVLFLFVIAYLGGERELARDGDDAAPKLVPLAIGMALVVAGLLVGVAWRGGIGEEVGELVPTAAGNDFGSVAAVGETFMVDYLLAFEVTSLVLLVAAVGGVVLGLTGRARQRRMSLLMQTRSTDEQRRWYARREAELRERRLADEAAAAAAGADGDDEQEGSR